MIRSPTKQSALLFVLLSLSFSATSCAYLQNRLQDAADIGTLAIGYGAGIQPRVGPVSLGLIYQQDVGGLRAGQLLSYACESSPPVALQVFVGSMGFYSFVVEQVTDEDRGKGFAPFMSLMGIPVGTFYGGKLPPAEYYSDIEVAVGVGIAVRAGFNPGELLDFVLGWFGVDIYDDDAHQDEREDPPAG